MSLIFTTVREILIEGNLAIANIKLLGSFGICETVFAEISYRWLLVTLLNDNFFRTT